MVDITKDNVIEDISLSEVMLRVVSLHEDGWRFLTITADEIDAENMTLIYHFDKEYKTLNLKTVFNKGTIIPSVSPIYFAAFWPENEVQDLYGVQFSGLKINYKGTMYFDDTPQTVKMPFCRYTVDESEEA